MGIVKPSVSGRPPIIIEASKLASSNPTEVIGVHYLNTTSEGKGRVNLRDGGPAGEIRIVLGASEEGATDSFYPAQPAKFNQSVYVEFVTGTGVVTVLMN